MNDIAKLAECEEMMMRIIWSQSIEMDSLTINKRFNRIWNKNWKLQTVLTVLRRLESKGYINISGERRNHRYKAIVPLETYRKTRLKEVLELYEYTDIDKIEKFIKNSAVESVLE